MPDAGGRNARIDDKSKILTSDTDRERKERIWRWDTMEDIMGCALTLLTGL